MSTKKVKHYLFTLKCIFSLFVFFCVGYNRFSIPEDKIGMEITFNCDSSGDLDTYLADDCMDLWRLNTSYSGTELGTIKGQYAGFSEEINNGPNATEIISVTEGNIYNISEKLFGVNYVIDYYQLSTSTAVAHPYPIGVCSSLSYVNVSYGIFVCDYDAASGNWSAYKRVSLHYIWFASLKITKLQNNKFKQLIVKQTQINRHTIQVIVIMIFWKKYQ